MTICFEIASLAEGRPHIEEMLPAQWAETGDPGLMPAPNWAMYEQIERVRGLILLIGFEQEIRRPVAYLAMFVHPHPNATHVRVATISTYYVEERTQRAMMLRAMVQYAVRLARQQGVYEVRGEVEGSHQDAGRLWQALGFEPYKVSYRMVLAAEAAQEAQNA